MVVHVQTLKRDVVVLDSVWLPAHHFLPGFQSFASTVRSGLPAFPLSDVGKATKATDRCHFWLPRPLGGISDMLDNVHVLTLDHFLRIKNSSKSLEILFLVVLPNTSLLRCVRKVSSACCTSSPLNSPEGVVHAPGMSSKTQQNGKSLIRMKTTPL